MIKEEKSGIIRRPIEEVFAYVSDLRHSPEWQSGLVEVRQTTEGPQGVGTVYVRPQIHGPEDGRKRRVRCV